MHTILIIEDEEDIRERISDLLELNDYKTYKASDGIEGLRLANEILPDLILCDVLMPGLNGHQVLYSLKNNHSTAFIPFIFLTAKVQHSDYRKGMALGADDYITKPFDNHELLKCIETRLEKYKKFTQKFDNYRSILLTVIPHEFLTPLNAIIGFSGLLKEDLESNHPPDKKELLDYSKYIQNAGEKLLRLVNNYILLSKLTLEHSLDISDLTAKTISSKNFIESIVKGLEIKYNRHNDIVLNIYNSSIYMSENHFEICIYEVIDNSFKFSAEGQPIIIQSIQDPKYYILEISDTGIGMTAKEIKQINAFNQFENKKQFREGLGIGLILTQKLLEYYSGNLEVVSKPEGGTIIQMKFLLYKENK